MGAENTLNVNAVLNSLNVRESLKTLLQNEMAVITFTKKDGTVRKMKCSLKKDFLPPIPEGYIEKSGNINESVLNVWDLEAHGWRSFRLDSLTSVTIIWD